MRDRTKQGQRLATLRLRYAINTHLDKQRLTAPPDLAQAVRRLSRRLWRDGDVAALQAVADRLGLKFSWRASTRQPGRDGWREPRPRAHARGCRRGPADAEGRVGNTRALGYLAL